MTAATPAYGTLDCLLGGAGFHSYCTADCNGDDAVTVDEVLTAVDIALAPERLESCPRADIDLDSSVVVFEIVAGVDAALRGCRLPAPGFDGGVEFRTGATPAGVTQTTVHLSFTTTADFPCLGYVLPVAWKVSMGTEPIVIVLGCPFMPHLVCLTALGPATGHASFTVAHGRYEIHLRSQSATDRYTLEVTADAVAVTPIEIAFSTTVATRTPSPTSTATATPTRPFEPSPTPSSNRPPLHARAEAIPSSVYSGETVSLDGSHSSKGKSFSGYWWRQSKGTPEILSSLFTQGPEQLELVAPVVAFPTQLEFELMVRGLGNGCCGPITEHISIPSRLTVLPAP